MQFLQKYTSSGERLARISMRFVINVPKLDGTMKNQIKKARTVVVCFLQESVVELQLVDSFLQQSYCCPLLLEPMLALAHKVHTSKKCKNELSVGGRALSFTSSWILQKYLKAFMNCVLVMQIIDCDALEMDLFCNFDDGSLCKWRSDSDLWLTGVNVPIDSFHFIPHSTVKS